MGFFLLSLATSLFNPTAAVAGLQCQAIYRGLDEQNNTVEKSAAIPVARKIGNDVKFELDFEGRYFALTETLPSGDLFAQIIHSDDDTKGAVVRGAADSQGRFTTTEVVGTSVYRMECSR